MFAPGFGKEVMRHLATSATRLQWLAERRGQGPALRSGSACTPCSRALTGQEPLAYPDDTEAPDYRDQLTAWQAQDATFRAIAEKFVAENYNLKTVFREVILSPYFRGRERRGHAVTGRAAALGDVGTGRLSTPELLARKIQAVTGVPLGSRHRADPVSATTDYKILYGGIDSDNVTQRLTVPNGIMASVAVAHGQRGQLHGHGLGLLAPGPVPKPVPVREARPGARGRAAQSNAANVDAIKKNIQYLHALVLGESSTLDDPEIARTYQLFYDTWKEGSAKVTAKNASGGLVAPAARRQNPLTRQDLPSAERLEQDKTTSSAPGWRS